jgi:hypothetical protein
MKVSPMMLALYGVGAWLLYSLFKNTASAATPAGGTPAGGTPGAAFDTSGWDAIAAAGGLAPSPAGSVLTMPALQPLPGSMAPTQPQIAGAVSFWDTLAPATPPMSGYIQFPSGSQAAAALFGYGNTAMDNSGNFYVQWAGGVYRLANTPDRSGNWASVQVA